MRNRDRRYVEVTSKETRIVRRARRRAEKAEITGARAGKFAKECTRNGFRYA